MAGKVKLFSGSAETPPFAADPHTHTTHSDTTKSLYIDADVWRVDSATDAVFSTSPKKSAIAQMADGASQGVFFKFRTPADMTTGSTFTVYPQFTAASTVTGAIRWQLNSRFLTPNSSDITLNGTTTAWTGTSALRTQDVLYEDATGQALSGSPTAGDIARCSLLRLGGDALDTMGIQINLYGIRIEYTANH